MYACHVQYIYTYIYIYIHTHTHDLDRQKLVSLANETATLVYVLRGPEIGVQIPVRERFF
jgi:hypothetical protein